MDAADMGQSYLLNNIARCAMLERGLLWASIDNDDSRDLDQLSVAQPLSGGMVKILVAIADVDALAHRGSPIDDHARSGFIDFERLH
jgi:exoribonuclease II